MSAVGESLVIHGPSADGRRHLAATSSVILPVCKLHGLSSRGTHPRTAILTVPFDTKGPTPLTPRYDDRPMDEPDAQVHGVTEQCVTSAADVCDAGMGASSSTSACSNTCNHASDGDCDDGGSGAEFSNCAQGTDCADCGPREEFGPSCFPSSALVTHDDGRTTRIDELQAGDRILAARTNGSLGFDTVSRFSIAQKDVRAAFVTLTAGYRTITLTSTHHLPVGSAMALKQAGDVMAGETIWLADAVAASLGAQIVTAVEVSIESGLHNPLLIRGGRPIVDGVATSFDIEAIVAVAALAVPMTESICVATGTCDVTRKLIASMECAAKHAFTARPTCKAFHYIDGPVIHAASATDASMLVAGLVAAAAMARALHLKVAS